jgi:beta-glucanase (GH16 family)
VARLSKRECAPGVYLGRDRGRSSGAVRGNRLGGGLDFTDNFDSFDETRWTKGDHNLGRTYLNPENVSTSNGNLAIKLPARTLEGGEIRSNELYGSYLACIQVPDAPSSITGFFLYEPPDYASELDIEIYNDSSRKLAIYSTYAGGRQTHDQTLKLPFDPTKGFHEYRFDYTPTSLRFYADGQLMREWADSLPQPPMKLYVNAWYPKWLSGKEPRADKSVYVDSIQHVQQ